MRITANFDSGNIEVINLDNKDDIQLAIRPDEGGEFFQWFNFKLEAGLFNACQYSQTLVQGTATCSQAA